MQCKDIPDAAILGFLLRIKRREIFYDDGDSCRIATLFRGFPNSVGNAVDASIPDRLIQAKMAALIRRGLVDGCACGCRGDFTITDKGVAAINAGEVPE